MIQPTSHVLRLDYRISVAFHSARSASHTLRLNHRRPRTLRHHNLALCRPVRFIFNTKNHTLVRIRTYRIFITHRGSWSTSHTPGPALTSRSGRALRLTTPRTRILAPGILRLRNLKPIFRIFSQILCRERMRNLLFTYARGCKRLRTTLLLFQKMRERSLVLNETFWRCRSRLPRLGVIFCGIRFRTLFRLYIGKSTRVVLARITLCL